MHKAVAKPLATLLLMLLSGVVAAAALDEVAALLEKGNYQQALARLDSQPSSRDSRLLRANALAGLQRHAEAEGIYRDLIEQAPQDPTPYNNLAAIYAASGRLQEASELLNQAMNSDERYAAIYKNLSQVYVEMSRNSYAKALRMGGESHAVRLRRLDHRVLPVEPQQVAVLAAAPAPSAQPPAKAAAPTPVIAAAAVTAPAPVTVIASAPSTAPTAVVTTPVAVQTDLPRAQLQTPPAPVSQPLAQPADPADFDAGGAIAALKHWAGVWSAQDVSGYLAAYDAGYLPPRGLSLAEWQAERRVRLRKPGQIDVALSDFEVSAGGGGALTVKVVQRYRSDNYRDTTRKGFVMVRRNGTWKIGDEYTIEVIQ